MRALENVSFAVGKGETIALVGEFGSGKSVTAYAVMGILDPAGRVTGGRAMLGGLDLLSAKPSQLAEVRGREIAMIFQNPRTALNPIRPVGRQIADVLIRHGNVPRREAPAQAVEMLRAVGITDPARRAKAYPFEMSGGMCQRVMIAIALAAKPSLLIADEPTTGLDVTTQAVIMDLIDDLASELGMATIFITHDLALAGQRSARIVVMHAGHVVENAPTAELFAHPRHPYTAELIAATPDSAASLDELASIPGSLPDLRRTDLPPCRYSERCPRKLDACAQPLPQPAADAAHIVACWNPLHDLHSRRRRADRERGMTVLLDVAEVSKLFPVGGGPGALDAAASGAFRRPGEAAESVCRRQRQLRHRQGRDGRSGRRIRLRQVDAGARAHAADRCQRRQRHARHARTVAQAGAGLRPRSRSRPHPDGVPGRRRERQSALHRFRRDRRSAAPAAQTARQGARRARRDRGRPMRAAARTADALSASALRRPARPRRHCPRHRGRARTPRARRADRGARRLGAGRHPAAAAAAEARARHELSVRVARSLRGAAAVRPGAGDVSRQDRRIRSRRAKCSTIRCIPIPRRSLPPCRACTKTARRGFVSPASRAARSIPIRMCAASTAAVRIGADACKTTMPALRGFGARQVACHFAEDFCRQRGPHNDTRKAVPQARSRRQERERLSTPSVSPSAQALGLRSIRLASGVKFNLQLVLRHAALVDEFALPDDAEPAPVFQAYHSIRICMLDMPATDFDSHGPKSPLRSNPAAPARSVVEAAFARIASAIRCSTRSPPSPSSARMRAPKRSTQRARAAKPLGPLAGVPFAVKNLFDVAGLPTLAGSKINRDLPPASRDAALIERLEAAGAILVGALNMGEYAYDFTGENIHDGASRNPHDMNA